MVFQEKELDTIDSIIERINKRFGMNLIDADRLIFEQMVEDFKDMDGLKDRAIVNSYEEFVDSFSKKEFLRGISKRRKINQHVFDKVLKDNSFKHFVIETIARDMYEHYTG